MDLSCINIRLDSSLADSSWTLPTQLTSARRILYCDAGTGISTLAGVNGVQRQWQDPLAALDWMAQSIRQEEPSSRWIGYLSYDLGRLFERLPELAQDDLRLPLFVFTFHDSSPATAADRRAPRTASPGTVKSNFTRATYEAAVARAIEYIRAGDVFQVNLSQRFTTALTEEPDAIYSRLNARYGALLDYGAFALVSASPELYLRVEPDGRLLTRPIKGTRPLLPGMEIELRESLKDQAELNMIVDLERNDIGRVCRLGSVRVTEPRIIEAHPTLYHAAASITGMLRENTGFADILRAAFPGGSVTGAPKIRAMEIIDQIEPVRRGPYCGSIGYLAADGSMEFNVAIRTLIVKNGEAHFSAGGGIVADSLPAAEYDETLVKASALFAALRLRL